MNFSSIVPSRMMLIGMLAAAIPVPQASADVVASTGPYGVLAENVGRGARGLAFPLIESNLYVGRIEANASATLVLSSDSGDPRSALVDAGPAYVEVLDGAFEGERLDLDVAATLSGNGESIAVSFGNGTHSTRGSMPADALAGARITVRPHVTLARVQAMLSPALDGSNAPGRADSVLLFENERFIRYTLRGDGETWVRSGSNADQRHRVIPPDTSVLIDTRQGGRAWVHTGAVRTNAFRKNLVEGEQAFASGFPVALSPIDVGGFVDLETPAKYRWRGALLFPFADWFEEQGDLVPILGRIFLQPNGTSWRRLLDLRDVAHQPVLDPTAMFVLRRNNPDPEYLIPVPF